MAQWRSLLRQLGSHQVQDPLRVISVFKAMQKTKRKDPVADPYAYASLTKACNKLVSFKEGKSVHGRVIRLGLDSNVNVCNSLIHLYMGSGRLVGYASVLFDRMPARTVVTVNCMVSGFLRMGRFDLGLDLFKKVLSGGFGDVGLKPNFVTLVIVVSGCVEYRGFQVGKSLHCYCCKVSLDSVTEVCNVLVDFYGKFRCLDDAVCAFSGMDEKDLVSWNTMIVAYARSEKWRKAFSLFREMRYRYIGYDRVSLINLLLACANGGHVRTGKLVHGSVIICGAEMTVPLGTVLINMYCRCGFVEFARKVFDELPDKNVAVWNSMIHGYAVSGHNNEALELFNLMKSTRIEPDEVTMLGVILACRNSGELSCGIDIHSYIDCSDPLNGSVALKNALVDMYAKCGDMAQAKTVFSSLPEKDVISWTSIIVGHAVNGEVEEALLAFQQMRREKVEPNFVTFIGVLSACDHSGMVDVGRSLYDMMCNEYNIKPNMEHYGCVVDMLARAGKLEEADKFVKKMPVEPNSVVWRMLINACRLYDNVDLGLNLVHGLIEGKNSATSEDHIISSNIFAEAGRWNDVLHARSMMLAQKAPKVAGTSFVPG